jgi:hypothetical protein
MASFKRNHPAFISEACCNITLCASVPPLGPKGLPWSGGGGFENLEPPTPKFRPYLPASA